MCRNTFCDFFRLKEEREIDSSISVSVVEIYNEKIRDLLQEKSVESNHNNHNYSWIISFSIGRHSEEAWDSDQQKWENRGDQSHHKVTTFTAQVEKSIILNRYFRQVSSGEEFLTVVNRGMRQRAVTSTLIHEHSSRSHLIVTVQISLIQAPPPPSMAASPGNISAASSAHSLDRTITPVHSAETTPVVWHRI